MNEIEIKHQEITKMVNSEMKTSQILEKALTGLIIGVVEMEMNSFSHPLVEFEMKTSQFFECGLCR